MKAIKTVIAIICFLLFILGVISIIAGDTKKESIIFTVSCLAIGVLLFRS